MVGNPSHDKLRRDSLEYYVEREALRENWAFRRHLLNDDSYGSYGSEDSLGPQRFDTVQSIFS